ncbi:carbohydrate ABC transporter permease [Streptomyces sp. NPDC091376]|uniref:carbohydrate ABC transporter permease n=1 Tax=Streptomyces sp. NPDC091376 TaxID=3365994 RepID=UPI00381882B1
MTTTTHTPADRATGTRPPALTAAPPRNRDLRALALVAHLTLALWALTVIAPLLFTFLGSFKDNAELFDTPWSLPGALRWENWANAWSRAHIGRYMLNSLIVCTGGVFLTMLLGSMAAYVLARYRFPGNRFTYYLFVSGLLFPQFLALVPLFFVVRNLGLLGTHTGLILVYAAYGLPFTVFFLSGFFKTLPTSVAEAARIDGASHTRTFFQIMLPMAKPAVISLTIFNFLGQWNQYILPLMLLPGDVEDKWVLTQGIENISTEAGAAADWGSLFAALTLSIIPVLLVYVFFQRQIQSGLTNGALK